MLLESEPNIREVIPFAKTGEGKDLMMNAPAPVNEKQLKELGIKV
jgi:aspartyl-tRNA synthetase